MKNENEINLYYVEEIQNIVHTILYTAWIRDESPVSILLIGPSGTGKSKLVVSFSSPCFHETDSVTSKGLFDIALEDKDKKLIRYILIKDFNGTLSRKSSTLDGTLANLLSFTSDGTTRVDDGRSDKICLHDPIGIITAATTEIYKKNARRWYELGLRRRILPLFYRYCPATIMKLQSLAARDKIHSSFVEASVFHPGIEKESSKLITIPDSIQDRIIPMSVMLASFMGKDSKYDKEKKALVWMTREMVPISPQVTLKIIARANALKNKRSKVDNSDLEFLANFLSFCDPENPRQL